MKSLRCLVPFVIVALLLAGVLYLVEAPVTTAATCTVTTTADSGAGSLREKLADATCDTVDFDASLAGQTITLTSQLEISRSVTVDGRGLSAPLALSGNQAVRVVKVITGQVTLAGLTLTYGNAPAETEVCVSWGTSYRCGGGLLVSTGAVVTLTASTIVSNTADMCGGGILNRGTLVVLSSTIANNVGYCAGGIASGNGQHLATTLVVRDSTFSNNIANDIGHAALGGGAIWMGAGSLTVENSVFQNNYVAEGGGGAINVELYLDKLTVLVRNSLFTHNSAPYGGAMDVIGADMTLEGNLFADNTGGVGAVQATGNMTLTNNTFSGNIATLAGGMVAWQGVMTMTNNTFSDNAAEYYGGLYLAEDIIVTLRNNIIANSGDGADCRIDPGTGVIIAENTNNLIEDGSCSTGGVNFQSGDPRVGLLADNGGLLVAGHIISTHALLEDSPALDTGNNATCPAYDQRHLARPQGATCDRGAYERGPLQLGLRVTPDSEAPYHGLVTYTLVLTNTGAATDSGLWLTDTLPPGVTFESWIISPTGTTRSGDQLFWQGSLPSGATRTWVFAARNTGDFDLPGDYGDTLLNMAQVSSAGNLGSWAQTALHVTCGDPLTVQNYSNDEPCSLRDVAAKAPADATIVFRPVLAGKTLLQVYHPQYSWQTPPYATLLITKNLTVDASALAAPFTIDGNLAARLIYVSDMAHLTLNNLTLMRGNGLSAIGPTQNGGALLIRRGAAVTLTHVSMLSNTVGFEGAGGGIDVYGGGATLTVLDSVLAGNGDSGIHGGAIYVSPREDYANPITVTIRRSTFAGNVASRGGGILLNGGMTPIAAQYILIEDSTFNDNQVTELGGGIACWLSVNNPIATIKNSTFSGNVAGRGGGLFASSDCPMEITNSTFISNTGNSGNYISGGLSSDTVLTVTHSTFSGNSGGIGNSSYGSLFLRDTIIANSTSAADCTAGTLVVNVNNLIEDGSCSAGSVNFLSGDPLLGPLADNGGRTPTLALLAGSPAIDSADTVTCLPTDQRGVPRPQGAACDRGAYEAEPVLTLEKSVTPVAPRYHDVVTYTVTLTNSGIVTDAHALFTDTLPAAVNFGEWLEQPAGAVAAGNAITWTGTLAPGGALMFRFTATHTGAPREWVTNTAYFSGSVQVGHAEAGFQVTAYVITPTVGAGGVITPSTPHVINPGEDRVFTIAPNYGYHILDVGVDGVSVGAVNVYTFTHVTADHTITAAFAINTYVITPTAGASGSINPGTPQTVNSGGSITFTIVPSTSYHIADVRVDQVSVGAVTSYTFADVTADHAITAAFAINTYVITPTAGAGGTITPGTPQNVNYGASQVFTITPEVGYHLFEVGVDGVSVGVVSAYTLTNVTADHTISATFALNEYTLTASVVGQGQVTRTPDQATYLYGSVVTLTAVPQPGRYFGQWLGDASGVLTQTTVLMDANKVVTATFLNTPPTYYTLTLSLIGSGLITPTVGVHAYLSGTVVPLGASPAAGWLFAGWSGNVDCADGSVTMNVNKLCTATFARYQLYLPLVLR